MIELAKRKNVLSGSVQECDRQEPGYTRGQILASARYRNRKDLVSALLEEGRTYTMEEVDRQVNRFMKGEVK